MRLQFAHRLLVISTRASRYTRPLAASVKNTAAPRGRPQLHEDMYTACNPGSLSSWLCVTSYARCDALLSTEVFKTDAP